MPKRFEAQEQALTGLLGLGSHSARKSHYPELVARLEELEAERNRYKWLFEHAVHGIFQVNLEGGVLAANPAMARMLGYQTPDEVLQSMTRLAGRLFVGGEAELLQINGILVREGGLFGYETRLYRRDGSVIDVLMNLLLKPGEQGLVEGFVADITERVQAHQRMQSLNDELEQRVLERTQELQRVNRYLVRQIGERRNIEQQLREARDAAEEANRSKDKYLAAASHDLLQPLNAARLLISTLRERSLPEAEGLLVERTHQALEGAEDLLADLLDIARLDRAVIQPELADYDLDEILLPLASEFQPVAELEGLRLQVRSRKAVVRTDLRLLTRILRNFLSNACRYTEQGGVLLGARHRGDRLWLEVWDSGRGIPQDRLQEIFLEFSQLHDGRAAERKGVGLGLAIVERIARILGARIQVRSRLGRGSVFAIEVPLRQGQARVLPRPERQLQQLADPLPGRRLLVVDNEQSILDSMSALLGQWGCEVQVATDLAQAVELLQGRPPDVILADYHLDHGATGCELITYLRELFDQPLPAVLISADRGDQCRTQALGLGAIWLDKPLKPGKLRAVLSQLLAPGRVSG